MRQRDGYPQGATRLPAGCRQHRLQLSVPSRAIQPATLTRPACNPIRPACNPTRPAGSPVYAGTASVGGDSASTDYEIMRILPANVSLGARVPTHVPTPLTPGPDKAVSQQVSWKLVNEWVAVCTRACRRPRQPAQSGPTEADVAVHNYRRRSSWMWSSRRRTLEVERSRRSRSNLDSHSGVRAPTTLEQALLRATLILNHLLAHNIEYVHGKCDV